MKALFRGVVLASMVFWMPVVAAPMAVQDMSLNIPPGWQIAQSAKDNGTTILGFSKGDEYVSLFIKSEPVLDMKSIFVNGSEILSDKVVENHSGLSWEMLETQMKANVRNGKDHFVTAFKGEFRGMTYYGYSSTVSHETAANDARLFLDSLNTSFIGIRSLTGADYTGKKYYFGFGDSDPGPEEMVNEVKYDVQHTNNIFTSQNGGSYIGSKMLSENMHSKITSQWRTLKSEMTPQDMYIQYSSGHGSHSGLLVGVDYSEIRDATLAMPAKEIVIFTMACYSGNLVDSFNDQKSVWQDWQSQGRTLFVMSSSRDDEESSTGPGTDPNEPSGPDGSAGSAFGNALWRALIGGADGEIDGVKDGYVSIAELKQYTEKRSLELGSQNPASTGAYDPNLKMTRVPSRAWVASQTGGTDGMTDKQIMKKVQDLNQELSLR